MRSLCSVFCVLSSEFCDLCSVFCVPCAVFCALFRVLCTVLCTVHCAAQQPVSKLLSGGRNSHESRQLDSPLHITTGHQTPVHAPVGASTRGVHHQTPVQPPVGACTSGNSPPNMGSSHCPICPIWSIFTIWPPLVNNQIQTDYLTQSRCYNHLLARSEPSTWLLSIKAKTYGWFN